MSSEAAELRQRLEALEAVEAAARRLADAGPVSAIVARAPGEAASASGLHRVILSRVDDGRLHVDAAHGADLGALQARAVELAYPLLEGELLRRRRGAVVDGLPPERQAHWDVMRWAGYVVAPVVLGGRVVGFFHGDRSGAPPGELERDALERFAGRFGDVYERAVLLRRLQTQRRELREVAAWADTRALELADGDIDLAHDREATPAEDVRRGPPRAESRLEDLLTKREVEVLSHMVRGESNADIARVLVVSEGTVKFHVKNILRKMHVSNRAEATSRYLRSSLRDSSHSG